MASVLITGMTAPQCSPRLLQRSTSFAAAVKTALEGSGISVELCQPSIRLDKGYVKSFDKVVVGVSPVLSLSSNYVYGALSVLASVLEVDKNKLVLLADSPEPAAARLNISAVYKSRFSLFKPFYSARKEYAQVVENKSAISRIDKAIDFLSVTWDVPTLYPSFPFLGRDKAIDLFQHVSPSTLVGVDVDALYSNDKVQQPSAAQSDVWCVDTDKSPWFSQVRPSLKKSYVLMKQHRGSDDLDVDSVVSSSMGAIISPARSGHLWWSYRYNQALRSGVPIATEWRLSSVLGPSWAFIAPTLEETSLDERISIAEDQRKTYQSAIKDRKTVVRSLIESIGLNSYDNSSI